MIETPTWNDGSFWGDGDYWTSTVGVPVEYVAEYETIDPHDIALRVNYTATVIPGEPEAFVLHSLRLRSRMGSQKAFNHYTFVDAVTPSERLAVRVEHTGSDFMLSRLQLIAQPKKHQQHG